MKCAKCGNEISPDAVNCPYCTGEAASPNNERNPATASAGPSGGSGNMMMRCPRCGSHKMRYFNGDYSLGLGCLGALLFGWIGLLLGLLGISNQEVVCGDCGYRAPLNRTQASCSGCGCLIVIAIIVLVIIRIFS